MNADDIIARAVYEELGENQRRSERACSAVLADLRGWVPAGATITIAPDGTLGWVKTKQVEVYKGMTTKWGEYEPWTETQTVAVIQEVEG